MTEREQFESLLLDYFSIGVAQGKEGRDHDDEANSAQETHSRLVEMWQRFRSPAPVAITKPCRIGATVFRPGIAVEAVIDRAEREYESRAVSVGTIGHLNEPEPYLQYEPGVVDPELVRQALQQVQHREGFGKGKVVPVWSVLIAAARYAIEDLQQKARAESPKVPQGVDTITVETAPMGTKAPSSTGGCWTRVPHGWQWCTGATFPRPGGDWTGELIQPALPQIPEGMVLVPVERTFESGALAFKELMIEATHAAIHPHIEGVYGVFEHRLAAAKENQ